VHGLYVIGALLGVLLAIPAGGGVTVPADAGLYYLHGEELTQIEARSVSVSQNGGGGSSKIPMKSKIPMAGGSKVSAQILGEQAEHTVTSIPVFYYRITHGDATTGAGDLVLVRMKVRRKRREFQLSATGDWKTSSGIPLRSQVEFSSKRIEPSVYQLTPSEDLDPGEYGFYLFRGRELPGLIYDFSVE
jgi:hypothetical protein